MTWFASWDYIGTCALVFMFMLTLDRILLHVGLIERLPPLVPHRKLRVSRARKSRPAAHPLLAGDVPAAARRGSAEATAQRNLTPAPGCASYLSRPGAGPELQAGGNHSLDRGAAVREHGVQPHPAPGCPPHLWHPGAGPQTPVGVVPPDAAPTGNHSALGYAGNGAAVSTHARAAAPPRSAA